MSVGISFNHTSCDLIPWQIQCEDLVFLQIPAGEKGPIEKGWNKVSHGKRYDDPNVKAHLERGGNISMNPSKGLVYCFRCGIGYDAAQWDAICRGIMPCGGTCDTDVMKRHLDQLNSEMPEVRFLERIAWKKARKRR